LSTVWLTDWSGALEHLLQALEVGRDEACVALELFAAHARGSAQREDNLASVRIREHPHRVVEDLTRGHGDVVVKDPEIVARCEDDPGAACTSLDVPPAVHLHHGGAESGRPLGHVGRIGDIVVDLAHRSLDEHAELPGLPRHDSVIAESLPGACAGGVSASASRHPGLRRDDKRRRGQPPVVERRVLHADRERSVLDLVESGRLEQCHQMAPACAGAE